MDTLSFKQDDINQAPALQLLQNLGYQYIIPNEVLILHRNKTTNVLLEDVLCSYFITFFKLACKTSVLMIRVI